jgi:hypothetical protein
MDVLVGRVTSESEVRDCIPFPRYPTFTVTERRRRLMLLDFSRNPKRGSRDSSCIGAVYLQRLFQDSYGIFTAPKFTRKFGVGGRLHSGGISHRIPSYLSTPVVVVWSEALEVFLYP